MQTESLKLKENLPLYIQVGRTFLKFSVRKISKIFDCCEVSENPNYLYYYRQNEKVIEKNRIFTVKTEIGKESDGDEKEKNEEKTIEIKEEEDEKKRSNIEENKKSNNEIVIECND